MASSFPYLISKGESTVGQMCAYQNDLQALPEDSFDTVLDHTASTNDRTRWSFQIFSTASCGSPIDKAAASWSVSDLARQNLTRTVETSFYDRKVKGPEVPHHLDQYKLIQKGFVCILFTRPKLDMPIANSNAAAALKATFRFDASRVAAVTTWSHANKRSLRR